MLPLEIKIPLKVKEEEKIKLRISEGGGGLYPIYYGNTTVTPKAVEQTLETANKSVLSDITVLEIPYFETSNEKGTTAIIGGNG